MSVAGAFLRKLTLAGVHSITFGVCVCVDGVCVCKGVLNDWLF